MALAEIPNSRAIAKVESSGIRTLCSPSPLPSPSGRGDLVRILLLPHAMKTLCRVLVKDGDELLVAVPENRTVEFYNYLRGFGFCFTLHSRGFCEDNVFCFHESENTERLSAI